MSMPKGSEPSTHEPNGLAVVNLWSGSGSSDNVRKRKAGGKAQVNWESHYIFPPWHPDFQDSFETHFTVLDQCKFGSQTKVVNKRDP